MKPCGLLRAKGQPVDTSVSDGVRDPPVDVPASEPRLTRRAIEREDPLFAVSILEIPDVEVSGFVAERQWNPARGRVVVVNRQDGRGHVALSSPAVVAAGAPAMTPLA